MPSLRSSFLSGSKLIRPSSTAQNATRKRITRNWLHLTSKSPRWALSKSVLPSGAYTSNATNLTSPQNQNPLILCVVDADDHTFSPEIISQGLNGGRVAAQELTRGIAEYLSQEDVQVFGRLSFWVTIYYNKKGLLQMTRAEDICTPEVLEAFLVGLSQASPRFLLVDVGPGKDSTSIKIQGTVFALARLDLY